MTYESERDTIRQRFNDRWDSTAYPVAWPNDEFDPPDPEPGNAWVRLTIQPAQATEIELGPSARIRHPGNVIIQVFTPSGEMDEHNTQLCDTAAGIYRGYNSGGLRFRAPYVNDVGSDGTWYQQNVVCPYRRDSTS